MTEHKLSVADKLVVAAHKLTMSGKAPFTAEDLVVAAWRAYPDTFGLPGYADADGRSMYPDSNRVFAEIMGTKPVRERGYLVKVGNKLYQLTEAGTHYAGGLLSQAIGIEKIGLARPLKEELGRLLKAKATDKFKAGRIDEITFYDACGFWKISARSTAIEYTGRYNNIKNILASAKIATQGKSIVLQHGGDTITLNDVNTLQEIHHLMHERFAAEIDVILRRTDQR
jgi:hypothetical protein